LRSLLRGVIVVIQITVWEIPTHPTRQSHPDGGFRLVAVLKLRRKAGLMRVEMEEMEEYEEWG